MVHPDLPARRLLRPRVHTGFFTSWRCNGLNVRVLDYLRQLLDSGEVDREAALIYVTGHSLGSFLNFGSLQ